EAALMIASNTGTPLYVALKGAAVSPAPRIEASPNSVEFGLSLSKSAATQQIIAIKNAGPSVLTISSISLADNTVFVFNDINCRGKTINPKDSCSISLGMKTKTDGDFKTSLVIQSNAQNNPFNVPLHGRLQLIANKTGPALAIYP